MIRHFISLVILAVFIWLVWSFSGRNTPLEASKSYISIVEEINPSDSLLNNIVGIQPFMEVSDYFNQVIFKEKVHSYLAAAGEKGFIKKNTLIIFPESIGTWLFLLNEKHNLAEKTHLNNVLRTITFSNAFDFLLGYIKTGDESNKEFSSIIRMKAKAMAGAYFETFSNLAIETNTYILAGSLILPDPTVMNGEIFVDLNGPLYDASFLFGPDGKIVGEPILKIFPNSTDAAILSAADPDLSQVFNLPFGKTSVILDYDSWYNQAYENAKKGAAEIILNPSFLSGKGTMHSKWLGFDGVNKPENIVMSDVGKLSNNEAWEKYAMPAQIKNTAAKVGFNVFFRGDFWDIGTAGQPIVVYTNKILPTTPAGKGGIWSLNF